MHKRRMASYYSAGYFCHSAMTSSLHRRHSPQGSGPRNRLEAGNRRTRGGEHSSCDADFPVLIRQTKPEPVATKPLNENDDGMRGPAADRLLRTNFAFHGQLAPVLTKASSLASI